MNVRPRQDFVAVRRDSPETVSSGGIDLVLPRDADQEPAQGEVIAVGPGKRNKSGELVPLSVKVGDRVLIGHYGGETYKVDGRDVVLLRDSELLGVIEGA